jgi:hypothetical protein
MRERHGKPKIVLSINWILGKDLCITYIVDVSRRAIRWAILDAIDTDILLVTHAVKNPL